MKTLLIISNIICLGYLLLIHIKFPKLTSVSQSYYKWDEKKGRGVIFYFWAVLSLLTLLPVWFSIAPDNLKFILFLSACGLGFVRIAPSGFIGINNVNFNSEILFSASTASTDNIRLSLFCNCTSAYNYSPGINFLEIVKLS